MPSTRTGLTAVLVRALVVPALAFLGVIGYLVGAGALAANTSSGASSSSESDIENPWKAGYSRQYPGCVASVLWPEHRTPAAIVVRRHSGEVDRIALRKASETVFTHLRGGDAEIIGACYQR